MRSKKYKKVRSLEQNRLYRKILSVVSDETWHDIQDLHEKMRMKFLYIPESWVQLAYCKSTSNLDTCEFTKYIENIKNFFAQFNIIIPDNNF